MPGANLSQQDALNRFQEYAAPYVRDAMISTLKAELGRGFRPLIAPAPALLFGPGTRRAPSGLPVAASLETVGLDLVRRFGNDLGFARNVWDGLIRSAYRIHRSGYRQGSDDFVALAHEAVDGVVSRRQAELRLALRSASIDAPQQRESLSWNDTVLTETCRAFLLVVRRMDGDLRMALDAIVALRQAQAAYEPAFLASGEVGHEAERQLAFRALRLTARYSLARAVELCAEFCAGHFETKRGRERLSALGVQDDIDRHIFTAREALSGIDPEARILSGKLGLACKLMVESSVFAALVPRRARALLMGTLASGKKPVLELWHSQREALRQNLLDPTKAAVVLSMPTSAGKTLLAELAISIIDPKDGRIVYLAPTRALVTQVALNLKRHLKPLELRVRVATPSFELNPVEDQVLSEDFDVLITTPEKLDLLVRADHVSVRDLALVIVDEAHGLNERERGARLELLLATLRRERAGLRFLLMTPFASNADVVARWLGGPVAGLPIVLDWRPNERVVGAVWADQKVRGGPRPLLFETLLSAHSDFPEGVRLDLGGVPADTTSAEKTTVQAAIKWADAREGGVLVLAQSRKDAQERAEAIAKSRPSSEDSAIEIVARYLEDEVGGNHPLAPLLRRGVAFHHAGLSTEARYLVERLAEIGRVRVLCATTTLAQGVHFPLSAAIIESIQRQTKGPAGWEWHELAPWEFWNIAGRVGRALEDQLGTIAFALPNAKADRDAKREKIQRYLQGDAGQVASSLIDVVVAMAKGSTITFNTRDLVEHKSLSAFLQYILHAVAVSGMGRIHQELEGLLRGSLVFEQAGALDPDLADALIRLGRAYLSSLGGKGDWYFRMADGTGFSSPSVDLVFARSKSAELDKLPATAWSASALFPDSAQPSQLLVEVVRTLSLVPEVQLGSEEGGEFSPERIARITSSWVNGASLSDLARAEYDGDLLRCCQHVYSKISNLIPWGLRAVHRIVRRRQSEGEDPEADLASAMVFHGVRSAEGIALRMNGVPRLVAERLAGSMRRDLGRDLHGVRLWLERQEDGDWERAMPLGARTTGAEVRRIWEVLEGAREASALGKK